MVLKRVTASATDPISLADAKNHLKILTAETDDDDLITRVIKSATEMFERQCKRALVTQTWEMYSDNFREEYHIYKCPVQTINSIKYYDVDGTLQTVASTNYFLDNVSEPNRLIFKGSYVFPEIEEDRPNGIIVNFDAGYGVAAVVPADIISCLMLLLSHWYENREAVVISNWSVQELPIAVQTLVEQYDIYSFGSVEHA